MDVQVRKHLFVQLQILACLSAALLRNESEAMICTIGQEVDPYTRRPRWLIQEEDPCQCTEIRKGCFNTFLPRRSYRPTYYDDYVVSSDPLEIRLWLNCTGCSQPGPLGVEDGRIPDDHITASSLYHNPSINHSPQRGRLNTEGLPAAWVALTAAPGEWIQVDLATKVYVTGLITQGRGSGDGLEQWVKKFKVLFSDDGESWTYVTNAEGLPIEFVGNFDPDTQVVTQFPTALHTRYVRIVTAACKWHCCMRFEVLGCRPSE